jgi:hypothetical protein
VTDIKPKPRSPARWDKTVTAVAVSFLGIVLISFMLFMYTRTQEQAERLAVYRYCLDLGYTPPMCYETVYNVPEDIGF